MIRVWTVALPVALAACAPGRVEPELLRITAHDAAREARLVAVGWAEAPVLRYVEGEGVTPAGAVPPGRGAWRFIYEAADRADQLVVTITPEDVEQTTRPRQSPPGFVLGDAPLPEEWIDAPAALAAARAAGAEPFLAASDAAITLLLLPLRPPQWVVRVAAGGQSRQWRVDARSGEVLER
jgi:hypothetical protein